MRQGQQNRRGRGRNNNRKAHHNPLTRSYESNGPDVKIRGTPSHIAEKYMSLARVAQSSGDPVLAENYLQHAEHYNRIIMTFREQSVQMSGEAMNGVGRHRDSESDDFSDEDMDEADGYTPQYSRGQEPQPRTESQSRFEDRPPRQSRDQGRPVRDRYQEPGEPRSGYAADRQPQQPAQQPIVAEQPAVEPVQQPRAEAPPRRRDRFAASAHEQPEFLRRPVRRPRREANGGSAAEANGAAVKEESGD
jgi:hypothetical protein